MSRRCLQDNCRPQEIPLETMSDYKKILGGVAMKENQNSFESDDDSSNDGHSSTTMNENFGLAIHAPDGWQEIISPQKLQRLVETGDQVGLHVLVGDIRKSTFLMKESI